ncbi:MAG: hypothetical protein IJ120_02790 [Solobacterium sp.]|nr:hypothetical protein [Solobacterium sp.]
MNTETKKRIMKGAVLLAIFILMLVLNALTVNSSDDFVYSHSNSIGAIFRDEYKQYLTWTGRSIAHLLARTFMNFPKAVFNVFNAGCFTCFVWLLCRIAAGRDTSHDTALLILAAGMIFIFTPFAGEVFFWETGACNYLWTTTFILLFLSKYRMAVDDEDPKRSLPFTIGMFFMGLLAGWSNENNGGGAIMCAGLLSLYFLLRKKLKPWMITGLAGAAVGFLIMYLSPGNALRSEVIGKISDDPVYNAVGQSINLLDIFTKPDKMAVPILIFFAAAGILAIRKSEKPSLFTASVFAASGFAASAVLAVLPNYISYNRAQFGPLVFITAAALICVHALLKNNTETSVLPGILTGTVMAYALFQYGYALTDLGYTKYQLNDRYAYIEDQKAKGNMNIIMPNLALENATKYNEFYSGSLFSANIENNINLEFAQRHGVDTVSVTDQYKWKALYEHAEPALLNIRDMRTYLQTVTADKNYVVLLNSSFLDPSEYAENIRILESYGLSFNDEGGVTAVYKDGKWDQPVITYTEANEDEEEVTVSVTGYEMYADIDNKKAYVVSGPDGIFCDIAVDGTDYTNDNDGINAVVYSLKDHCVVDSLTWNSRYGTEAVRYLIPKG